VVLNTAYAYLAEQAEAADAVALPAYRVAGIEDREIAQHTRRAALDNWLNAPPPAVAKRDAALIKHLTG
jgi:hypothetical protein